LPITYFGVDFKNPNLAYQLKRRQMKLTLKIIALFAIIFVSSCKKDFEQRQNRTLLLTKPAGWVTLKIEQKETNGSWTDITSGVDPFDRDNVLIFDPYYVWAINEGLLRYPGNPIIAAQGTWSFVDDATKIQFVGGNTAELTELTETSMQYTVTTSTSTNRFTYKHP
jgi:hypothetical protein